MIVAITQRVQICGTYDERRDTLDQRWITLLSKRNITAIPIPNNLEIAKSMLENIPFEGVILTGGEDLGTYGGASPERDETEMFLMEYAFIHHLPLLGVCRGMQMIQDYFDVPLKKVPNHVNQIHTIVLDEGEALVNSYHNWGAITSSEELIIVARAKDGVVEAIRHATRPIRGIMWHPERNEDLALTTLDKSIFSIF